MVNAVNVVLPGSLADLINIVIWSKNVHFCAYFMWRTPCKILGVSRKWKYGKLHCLMSLHSSAIVCENYVPTRRVSSLKQCIFFNIQKQGNQEKWCSHLFNNMWVPTMYQKASQGLGIQRRLRPPCPYPWLKWRKQF